LKLKDFLRKLAEDSKIVNTDYNALLTASAIADIEVPEDFVSKYGTIMMTREKAANDSEIVGEIQRKTRADMFDKVDEVIAPLYSLIPEDKAKEIGKDKIKYTLERIEKLDAALKESFESVKTKASSKATSDFEKDLKAEKDAHKATKDGYEAKITDIHSNHRKEKIDSTLESKLNGFQFSDEFNKIKKSIIKVLLSEVKEEKHDGNPVVIDLSDSGEVVLKKSVDGTLRDIYVTGSNDVLTLDKLLEKKAEPYIKKSNGTAASTTSGTTRQQTQKVDVSKMTLAEQRAAMATEPVTA
jgi:hypothetical protein